MKKNGENLQLPVTSKQILSFFISAVPVIAVGGYLYAEFENRLDLIELNRLEDRAQIEELVQDMKQNLKKDFKRWRNRLNGIRKKWDLI